MMTPEAQLSAPFFLGGSQILVSYPTNTMEYDARLQSMRGNNIPFSHAVAFHEMIPLRTHVGRLEILRGAADELSRSPGGLLPRPPLWRPFSVITCRRY